MDSRYNYELNFSFKIIGISKEKDIVGAIFGQLKDIMMLEGIDIEKLSKIGKIGYFKFNLNFEKGDTFGTCKIPLSLGIREVSLIAAGIELIDKIGPSKIEFKLLNIKNYLEEKRKKIKLLSEKIQERLKKDLNNENLIQTKKNIKNLFEDENFIYGIDFNNKKKIIITEGRADLIILSKCGFNNTIAIKGIPTINKRKKLKEIFKEKFPFFLVDSDSGGKLILNILKNLFENYKEIIITKKTNVQNLEINELKKILKKYKLK